MYRLVGSSPSDYTNELITNQTPLLAPYTLAQYGAYILYPSTDGIYATDGYTVTKITDKIDSKFSTIDTIDWGEIYVHKYFLTYNSETIITDLIQFPDNIKFITYNYNPNCYYYDKTSNILYSGDSTGIHQIEKAATQLEFTWQKNEITCSTSDTSLFNIYKYLRKIWINVNGTLTFYLYLDESNTAFLTKSITTTSMSRQEISLPYNTLCKKFDIKLVCTGRVDPPITIMYTVNNLQ